MMGNGPRLDFRVLERTLNEAHVDLVTDELDKLQRDSDQGFLDHLVQNNAHSQGDNLNRRRF